MKKTIRISLVVIFLLAIGTAGKAQCNTTLQWASCTSYGAGHTGGSWTLNCPTGNAYYDIEIYIYTYGGNIIAIAEVGSSDPQINNMINLGGAPGHERRNAYLTGISSSVDIYLTAYAEPNASAYASVTLW